MFSFPALFLFRLRLRFLFLVLVLFPFEGDARANTLSHYNSHFFSFLFRTHSRSISTSIFLFFFHLSVVIFCLFQCASLSVINLRYTFTPPSSIQCFVLHPNSTIFCAHSVRLFVRFFPLFAFICCYYSFSLALFHFFSSCDLAKIQFRHIITSLSNTYEDGNVYDNSNNKNDMYTFIHRHHNNVTLDSLFFTRFCFVLLCLFCCLQRNGIEVK